MDVVAQMDPDGANVPEVPDIKTQIQTYQDHFGAGDQSRAPTNSPVHPQMLGLTTTTA